MRFLSSKSEYIRLLYIRLFRERIGLTINPHTALLVSLTGGSLPTSIREKMLGSMHPATASSVSGLGDLYTPGKYY